MATECNIKIVNDLDLDLSYQATVNNKHICVMDKLFTASESNCDSINIKIERQNQWDIRQPLDIFLMLLFLLDFSWRNFADAEILPIGIHFSKTFQAQDNITIHLSNIIQVTNTGLQLWKKSVIIQTITVELLIICIGILMSSIVPSFWKIAFFAVIFFIAISLFLGIQFRYRQILRILRRFT